MNLDEALQFADKIEPSPTLRPSYITAITLAAEVRRLHRLQSDLEESDAVRDKCARLLAETAVALKGPEAALHRHGWHDLPEVAAIMRAEVTALRLYAPARRAQPTAKTAPIAPTNWQFWMNETDEEFAERAGRQVEVSECS